MKLDQYSQMKFPGSNRWKETFILPLNPFCLNKHPSTRIISCVQNQCLGPKTQSGPKYGLGNGPYRFRPTSIESLILSESLITAFVFYFERDSIQLVMETQAQTDPKQWISRPTILDTTCNLTRLGVV